VQLTWSAPSAAGEIPVFQIIYRVFFLLPHSGQPFNSIQFLEFDWLVATAVRQYFKSFRNTTLAMTGDELMSRHK